MNTKTIYYNLTAEGLYKENSTKVYIETGDLRIAQRVARDEFIRTGFNHEVKAEFRSEDEFRSCSRNWYKDQWVSLLFLKENN